MKIIISGLLIVLAFSSYMALTTDRRINPLQSLSPPKLERAEYVTPPAPPVAPAPVKIKPEPQQEVFHFYEIEIEEEDLDAETEKEYSENYSEDISLKFTSGNSIIQEIINVFGQEWKIALAVAKAESSLNPQAVNHNPNGTKDIGIFQINDSHGWSAKERFDWRNNISMAKELRDRNGWTEWVVYNNGTYRRFL